MTQVYILAGVGVALLIAGIIIGKIGSSRCKSALIVLGFFLGFAGVITGWFGYEKFMVMPTEYSVTSYREVDGGYKVTLASDVKGFTGGTIQISEAEAISLNLKVYDDEGNLKWVGGTIKESRRWISDHRDS